MSFAWVWLVMAIAGSVFGNMLIKRASENVADGLAAYVSPSFILGTTLFGLGLLAYMRALAALPLAIAYPVLVGCSMTFSGLFAVFWFKEAFTLQVAIGMALVIAGIAFLVHARQSA